MGAEGLKNEQPQQVLIAIIHTTSAINGPVQ